MTFNGPDKSNSLIADIDFLLFGTSAVQSPEYSMEDRTRNINIAWDEAVIELYKADPNHKWDDSSNPDLPFSTMDTVAGQDNYTLLDSALVIHRVRMKNQQGDFITLTPALRSELTDDDLKATGEPTRYYKIGGVVLPVPVPSYGATDGIEIEFQRGANHFTIDDTDASPGFNSQFHRFLSLGASLDYAMANGMSVKTRDLTVAKERMRMKMIEHFQLRSPDERPRLRVKPRSIRNYGL